MPEYRRLVAYIYQYQNGEKQKNTGYVKMEVRNHICRMQINVKMRRMDPEKVRVYGFVRTEDALFAIPLGDGDSRMGSLNLALSIEADLLNGTAYGVQELNGLWLKDSEDMDYISVWDDEKVQVDRFTLQLPKKSKVLEQSETIGLPESMEQSETMDLSESIQPEIHMFRDADMVVEENRRKPDLLDGKAMDASGGIGQRWQQFCNHYPAIQPFDEAEEIQCLKIMLKDISFLGKREQQFGSNPFVRQGFLKYGHLILGKMQDGRIFLGMPGICYDEQERQLARMYGFPEFLESERENKGVRERFGYWYHFL